MMRQIRIVRQPLVASCDNSKGSPEVMSSKNAELTTVHKGIQVRSRLEADCNAGGDGHRLLP